MTEFYREDTIKAIRRPGPCDGCGAALGKGEKALRCAGKNDGDFWSARYHPECRRAEEALNKLHETGFYDDWSQLADLEWEDWPWLIEEFPVVAERMKITTARYDAVVKERESVRLAWAEADKKRKNANAEARR